MFLQIIELAALVSEIQVNLLFKLAKVVEPVAVDIIEDYLITECFAAKDLSLRTCSKKKVPLDHFELLTSLY